MNTNRFPRKTNRWQTVQFESSTGKTPQFLEFARAFRSDINAMIKGTRWILKKFYVGHFYISGFFQDIRGDHTVYFSIPDVRFFGNQWYSKVLYRKANDLNDFVGKVNHFCHLENLIKSLDNLC